MNPSRVVFSSGDLLDQSWRIFKNNLGPLLGGFVLMMAPGVPANIFYYGSYNWDWPSYLIWLSQLVQFALYGPLMLGYYKMVHCAVAGHRVEFRDLFYGFSRFWPAFLAYFVIALFTAIGMLFCIIPGMLVTLVYLPVYLIILDGEDDFWKAMESSRKMVMDNFSQWLKLGVVLFLLNLAGMLLCCVGILVTAPMTYIVIALAYDQELGLAAIDTIASPVDAGTDVPQDLPFEE